MLTVLGLPTAAGALALNPAMLVFRQETELSFKRPEERENPVWADPLIPEFVTDISVDQVRLCS